MRQLRFLIALWVSKLAHFTLRILGRQGGQLPGVIALKICPEILERIATPEHKIGVTGSNGKSSLTSMLFKALQAQGYTVACNDGGNNQLAGAVTTLIKSSTFLNKSKAEFLILEIDELSAYKIAPPIQLNQLLVLNLFTDQYDRIAYESYLARKINAACFPGLTLVLNAQDIYQANLGAPQTNQIWYGVDPLNTHTYHQQNLEIICPNCHLPLKFKQIQYQTIGYYECEHCHLKNPEMDIRAQYENSTLTIIKDDHAYQFLAKASAEFQIYNLTAFVSVCLMHGVQMDIIQNTINEFSTPHFSYTRRQIGDYDISQQIVKFRTAIPAS